jgi:hypothetical protein
MVFGQGENPAQQRLMLTTATPVGAASSLGRGHGPDRFFPSVLRETLGLVLPDWAAATQQRHSLLEGISLAAQRGIEDGGIW